MSLTYYIDGYNVVHHCSRLKKLARDNFEAARDQLVERVGRFCIATGSVARVFFDGRGHVPQPAVPAIPVCGLDVVYSSTRLTADALIEREVYGRGDRRDLVIVTGDRSIRDLCRGLGTLVMTPDNFLTSLAQRLDQEREVHAARYGRHVRTTIEDGLSERSLRRLNAHRRRLKT